VTEDDAGERALPADITDFTRAEEIRARYAAIVESSDDAIIAKTLDGVISAWNAAAERMFGYTEHEAIGQPVTMIIPPALYDEEHDILRRLRTGERVDHL
jgi:PAS domain S-box-containing protein